MSLFMVKQNKWTENSSETKSFAKTNYIFNLSARAGAGLGSGSKAQDQKLSFHFYPYSLS